jgi:hypothetical protein
MHLFIHSLVDGHLGCFPLLAIMDNTAMSVSMNNNLNVLLSIILG